ncbi:MAG TPA: sialidase family protein, partial [Mycobacterium sp.]|nr:sialidase family protein [Mycobacterium sp.]
FSAPQLIAAPVLYSQGSRPVVGADGTVYVFFEGSTRLATLSSTYMVKSTDGGASFSSPVAVAELQDIVPLRNAAFRVNSFPAPAVAPNGDLYVAWSSQLKDSTGGLCLPNSNLGCHSAAVYSKSTDGGATWSAPRLIFPALDAANRTPVGYDTVTLAPSTHRVDTFWPAVAVSPSGRVYMSAYAADVVSPWQTCKTPATPTAVGRINCLELGPYVNNARLDYVVTNIGTGASQIVTTLPINTRSQFGGGFIGDYTDLAVGSDNVYHAFWTDTNNKQSVHWFYGFEFAAGTVINQEDVVTSAGNF